MIFDYELRSTMQKSIFPNAMKLSQLEDVDSQSTTRQMQSPTLILIPIMTVALILTQSSSLRMIHRLAQILGKRMKCRLWAKAGRGIWGLGYIFEGRLLHQRYC